MKTFLLHVIVTLFFASTFLPHSIAGPVSFPDSSFEGLAAGSQIAITTVGEWDLTSGAAEVVTEGGGNFAHTGAEFLLLPGLNSSDNTIAQTLAGFFPGVEYRCTYYLSGLNPQSTAQQCSIEIVMFGAKQDAYEYAVASSTSDVGDDSANPWVLRDFNFVADATSTTFSINVYRSTSMSSFAAFDTFTIVPIPKGKPKIKLKTPKGKRSSASSSRLILKGKVSGQLPGEIVVIQIGKKRKTIRTQGSWRTRVRLRPGKNKIRIQGIDIAGSGSKKLSHTVLRN